MYNHLDRIPACDRWTDRQTSCDSTVRTIHTHHVVNIYKHQKTWQLKMLSSIKFVKRLFCALTRGLLIESINGPNNGWLFQGHIK